MKHLNKIKKTSAVVMFAVDMATICVSYIIAMLLASSFFKLHSLGNLLSFDIFIFLASYFVFFILFRIHRTLWRYTDVSDIFRLLISSLLAGALYVIVDVVVLAEYGRLVFATLLSFMTTIGLLFTRIFYKLILSRRSIPAGKLNLAIIGAGDSGVSVLNNFHSLYKSQYNKVYLFDDDQSKIGRRIVGVDVVGNVDDLSKMSKELCIDEILIAIPSANTVQMNRIVDTCLKTKCTFFTLPSLKEVNKIDPKEYIKHKRKVDVNDLLGRDEVTINDAKTKGFIENKVIMVTGGGGSIGSELCRQISELSPAKLVIVDYYENNAYNIEQELLRKFCGKLNLYIEIATVREMEKVDFLFDKYKPHIVFHAAAHKHVPLMETNPEEAVKNNVFGTHNVIMAAHRSGVENFILISSDKAVNPTNVMGATKRICEMMIQSMQGRSKTKFSAVRFGNVLGSNGSVIPLFKNQIENGGPVTVTDKRMVRFFMTIPEAVSLVMEVARFSVGGDIFVLDMGKPINIDSFARKLIKLMGYEPDVDIMIEYVGLRPGEKLYEELLINNGNCYKTQNEKIFKEKMDVISPKFIDKAILDLRKAVVNNNPDIIEACIKDIVKTYILSDEVAAVNNEAHLLRAMKDTLNDYAYDKNKEAI